MRGNMQQYQVVAVYTSQSSKAIIHTLRHFTWWLENKTKRCYI